MSQEFTALPLTAQALTNLPEDWLQPAWEVPHGVLSLVTTRRGGFSAAPYASLNMGLHVGDRAEDVLRNRARLLQSLPAGLQLQWLEQVHGTELIDARGDGICRQGDAVYVDQPGLGGVVMTADCLPVFFASEDGKRVALAHAGWRGLLDGILEKTLARFPDAPAQVQVWFGPAIGPCHFEVGAEVRAAFLQAAASPSLAAQIDREAFRAAPSPGKFFANIYRLATLRLHGAGLQRIRGGDLCTVCDSARFYSYRRDGVSGRFASVIALHP